MNGRKRIIVIMILLFGLLMTTGVSTWIITSQVTFAPTFIDKITPTVVVAPTYEMFGTGTPLATNQDKWAMSVPGTFSNHTFTEPTSSTNYVNGTTDSTFTHNGKITFTPTESSTYSSVVIDTIVTIKAVAYISGGNNFYTIENALLKATSGNTVYAIVGANPTIKNSCTVESGVTLTLPYEGEKYKIADDAVTGLAGFADSNSNKVAANLKNNITFSKGTERLPKTLLVKGTLTIGGLTGAETNGIAGQTSGAYTQFTMQDYTKISVEGGTVNCYGYIKTERQDTKFAEVNVGTSTVSGTINAPFVVYDYRGGSSTVGTYAQNGSSYVSMYTNPNDIDPNICPFSVFDMPNIQTQLKINYEGALKGLADLYTGEMKFDVPLIGEIGADAQHNRTTPTIIAKSNAIINLVNSNSYIIAKYTPYWKTQSECYTVTDTNYGKTTLSLYNGATSGNLNLSLNVMGKTVTISTGEVLFPVSWKYTIELNSGTYSIDSKMKFMTGSKLQVNENAILNLNKEIIVYKEFTDFNFGSCVYPNKGEGQFIINGTANINSTFGGKIQTSSSNATLNLAAGIATSMSSSEGYGTRSGTNTAYTEVARPTETANSDILMYSQTINSIKTDTITQGATLISGTTYVSDNRSNTSYAENETRPWIAQNQTLTLSFGVYNTSTEIDSTDGTQISQTLVNALTENVKAENPSFELSGSPYIITENGNVDASSIYFFASTIAYQEYAFTGYLVTFNGNTSSFADNDYVNILSGKNTQGTFTGDYQANVTTLFNSLDTQIKTYNTNTTKNKYFVGWSWKLTAPDGTVTEGANFDPSTFTYPTPAENTSYRLDIQANWMDKYTVTTNGTLLGYYYTGQSASETFETSSNGQKYTAVTINGKSTSFSANGTYENTGGVQNNQFTISNYRAGSAGYLGGLFGASKGRITLSFIVGTQNLTITTTSG